MNNQDKSKTLIRIVDDDISVRNALTFMLENEGWKTKSYASALDFLRFDAASVPGCLILDVKMPGMTGLELQNELNLRQFRSPIVFLSAHGDIDMAVQTLKAGAIDFLQKPIDPERLLQVVSKAVDFDLKQQGLTVSVVVVRERFGKLTVRERQIVEKVALGLSNKEVAEALDLSERTVENHRASAYRKLEVNMLSQLQEALKCLEV